MNHATNIDDPLHVRSLRFSLLWPLRVIAGSGDPTRRQQRAWEHLPCEGESAWRALDDTRASFDEARYNEFVTFLPYVQRFLYGEGAGDAKASSLRRFVRHDIAQVRLTPHEGDSPIVLNVEQVELTFFYDVDVVLLKVAVTGQDLPLRTAQDILYRFGRGYPGAWHEDGSAQHCMQHVEWLDSQGRVLASSDARDRDSFLRYVSEHRSPRFARHWAFVLAPLSTAAVTGVEASSSIHARVRQIEYYRMPVMAYLAVNDPRSFTRSDFMRLALMSGVSLVDGKSPYAENELTNFEADYCYDRFWSDSGEAPRTRYLSSGHAFVVVGNANSAFFRDELRGVLAQFEHQHETLFMIAHFQKAALLMFSDRLSEAMRALDVSDPLSVKRFKRAIRASYEAFLRFTHRYWFHEISEQAQMRGLFRLTAKHLDLDPLYVEVKERMNEMNTYLEADSIRRQANTIVKLTVVTILGLIGTITTGFLGMNLLAEADQSMSRRVILFLLILIGTTALTVVTIAKSRKLSDMLDTLSDEHATWRERWQAFLAIWRRSS